MESPVHSRLSFDNGLGTPRSARHSVDQPDVFGGRNSFAHSSGHSQTEKGQEQTYFTDLLSYSLERLGKEPELLAAEKEQLKRQAQDAAVQHYKGFIEVSRCLVALRDKMSKVSQNLDGLQEDLVRMDDASTEFVQAAGSHAEKQTKNKQLLRQQGVLMEILEVPTLMDTCFRSGNYDDVLDLRAFVSKLALLHPDLLVVKRLVDGAEKTSQEMLEALLGRLRSNIQLPECLRVVAYLRRLAVFSEARLRQTFLQCREEWLSELIQALDEQSAYDYLKRLTDVHRLQLFDVVMQFRAIFSDEVTDAGDGESTYDGGAIFTWAEYRVMLYVEAIAKHVPRIREGGGLASVLEHCMYCGMSLGRVGLDFRGLLAPIFEACILQLFTSLTQTAAQSSLAMLEAQKWSSPQSGSFRKTTSFAKPPQRSPQGGDSKPPYDLVNHLPVAALVNGLLAALNELRHCCPLSIQSQLAAVLQEALEVVLRGFEDLKNSIPQDGQQALEETRNSFVSIACPYIAKCFLRLYSDKGPGLDLNGLTEGLQSS